MLTVTTMSREGSAGLETVARNHALVIGMNVRYLPIYAAAMAMPTGSKTTAGLVLKWKNRYWFNFSATNMGMNTSRNET
jgi:hypothetical protein